MRRALGILVFSFAVLAIGPHADARGGGGVSAAGSEVSPGNRRHFVPSPNFTGNSVRVARCLPRAGFMARVSRRGEVPRKFPYRRAGGRGGPATTGWRRIYRCPSRPNPRSSSFRPQARGRGWHNPHRTIRMRAAMRSRTGITVTFIREPAENRFTGGVRPRSCRALAWLACPLMRLQPELWPRCR